MHLNENFGLFRVYSSCQVRSGRIDHSRLELLGVLRHCDGVQVHYKEEILVLVLTFFGAKNTARVVFVYAFMMHRFRIVSR